MCEPLAPLPLWVWNLIIILVIWEAVWKLFAFWRSARNGHTGWFIAIAVFNTLGILPIVYLLTHKAKKELEA